MKIDYNNFIGFYRDIYPIGYCQHLINEFNRLEVSGIGSNRQQSEQEHKHIKDDYQIHINLRNHDLEPFKWTDDNEKCWDAGDLFFDGLQKCYDDYSTKYSILKQTGNIRATVMKMQRTDTGGGYHIWHCEQGPGSYANRVVVYMLYLNNLVKEGGETEFLYQKLRIEPEENLMLLWPASYTHAHRGNPVLCETHKYIVTGWFYFD